MPAAQMNRQPAKVSQTGGTENTATTMGITFTFSGTVELDIADITVNNAGLATVKITKDGIEDETKNVFVFKADEYSYTQGLAFTAIDSPATAYRVRKGTVTGGAVVIPAVYNNLPITEIGSASDTSSGAFTGTTITAVYIPDSVTTIGNEAFAGCTTLTSVTFAGADTVIGNAGAFLGDLVSKYSSGDGIGTYTTTSPASASSVWTKQ